MYQVLLGVYLCQCWKVEFKGITEPVLFMILFSDFVTPQKNTMSDGCWVLARACGVPAVVVQA